MGVAAFIGLSGGLLAARMGNRYGNLGPIVIHIILNAAFASTLALGTFAILFAASHLGWDIAYYFLAPMCYAFWLKRMLADAGFLQRMPSGG